MSSKYIIDSAYASHRLHNARISPAYSPARPPGALRPPPPTAMAGLTRCVRPPFPCRPSKFRFDVEAQRSPGPRMSSFMPRHIEQPGLRHSKPASVKIRSSPSRSACGLHPLRAGHHHRAHAAGHLSPSRHVGRLAQVFDPRVGARAEKDAIDLEALERRARAEVPCTRARAGRTGGRPRTAASAGIGNPLGDLGGHAGTGAPGDLRAERGGVDRARSRRSAAPGSVRELAPTPRRRAVPSAPLGARGRPSQVGERRLVGRDHPGPRARLDGHVAHRHPAFHRERRGWPRRCTR